MFHLDQIDHIALTVSDPTRSAEWYRSVLGLERRHQEVWGDRPIMMCAGNTCVALFPARERQPKTQANEKPPLAIRHFAFRADGANFQKAQDELRSRHIAFTFEDHKISHSIYFNDPDGHQIEITTYDLAVT